jgi:hypothetical protein
MNLSVKENKHNHNDKVAQNKTKQVEDGRKFLTNYEHVIIFKYQMKFTLHPLPSHVSF